MVTKKKNKTNIAQFHKQSAHTDNVHLKYVHKLDIGAKHGWLLNGFKINSIAVAFTYVNIVSCKSHFTREPTC